MKIVKDIQSMRSDIHAIKNFKKIALVTTMGNLHDGHLALVRQAKQVAEVVVVSIFVNPLQFGPNEDFSTYPRTLQEDIKQLSTLEVDYLFTPTTEEMFGDTSNQTRVIVPEISKKYCGEFRPCFFEGITTVVAKLFNIVQPDVAIYGEKDFQQLHIIKKMVQDLAFPLTILPGPTIREADGLAMSSRNRYLSSEERKLASEIYATLISIKQALGNQKPHREIIDNAKRRLSDLSFKVDYIDICNQETLAVAEPTDKELIILVAAWLGKTRLIDNISCQL